MAKKKSRLKARICFYTTFIALVCLAYFFRNNIIQYYKTGSFKRETVQSILDKYDSRVRSKFEPLCRSKGVKWPPARIYILAFKRERIIETWVADEGGPYSLLVSYPLTAFSGGLGPKRREGDGQIPEGMYQLTGLNPNSFFHLSIKVGYPNQEDVENSKIRRADMGGDIFIHGADATVGCLPIGNSNIEELFCLTAHAKVSNRKALIAPVDFRKIPGFVLKNESSRVNNLYRKMEEKLKEFDENKRMSKESAPPTDDAAERP